MKTKLLLLSLIIAIIWLTILSMNYYYQSSSYLLSSINKQIEEKNNLIENNRIQWNLLADKAEKLKKESEDAYAQADSLRVKNEKLYKEIDLLKKRIDKTNFSFFWKAYATEEEIKKVDSYFDKSWTWSWIINFDTIVIHHSATDTVNVKSISNYHKQRHQRCLTKRICKHLNEWYTWSYIDYHFVIFKDGRVQQTRPLDTEWWATKYNNKSSIHILIEWDLTRSQATEKQYKSLNDEITWLMKQFNIKEIKWHWGMKWEKTSCPWNLKWNKIWISDAVLSRYYSPTKDQKNYLPFEIKTCSTKNWAVCNLLDLYKSSVSRQFHWDNDITMPKDGVRYTDDDGGKTAACPKDKLGKSFMVLWFEKEEYSVYKCRDVWWAIKGNRIDIYAGIGDNAVKRFNDLPTGKQRIFWLDFQY